MIVVDCDVIAYLLIEGEKTSLARTLWTRENNWWMPELWLHEFLNILGHQRTRRESEVEDLPGTLGSSSLSMFEAKSRQADMGYTLSLAARYRLTAYDAQYIALAQSMDVLLISEDRGLRQAVPQSVRSMKSFLESNFSNH